MSTDSLIQVTTLSGAPGLLAQLALTAVLIVIGVMWCYIILYRDDNPNL